MLSRLAHWPGVVYLFVIPLALARSVNLLGLGAKGSALLLPGLPGYVLAGQPYFQAAIDRTLWLPLTLALATRLLPLGCPVVRLDGAPRANSLFYRMSRPTPRQRGGQAHIRCQMPRKDALAQTGFDLVVQRDGTLAIGMLIVYSFSVLVFEAL